MTEEKIIERLKNGDEAVLTELVAELSPLVSSVVYNLSDGRLSAADIEEITADAFIALWYSRDKIMPGRLRGYLLTIAKNKARDRIKKIPKQIQISLDSDETEVLADGFSLSEELEKRTDAQSLADALNKLDEKDREILIRHYYYYQTSAEIGKITDMSAEAVKKRISRGREKLKKYLRKGMSGNDRKEHI